MFRMLLMLLSMVICCSSQMSAEETINLNAAVLEQDVTFTLSSPTSGELKVKERMIVFNKTGLSAASFELYTDSFRSLSSFSGKIEYGGKVINKIKASDLVTMSLSSGLADDSYVTMYEPNAPYPCVIEYEYTVSYKKGIVNFPVFFPVLHPNVAVKSADYTLKVPAGHKIQYKASSEPEVSSAGSNDVYKWTVRDFDGYVYEHNMPSVRKMVPYVYSGPVDFRYAGTSGSLSSWEDLGDWIYSLQMDVRDVPQDMQTKVLDLVKDADSDLQKIRILYDFLRGHTRYVSIQLGIGGLKPFPVSTVWKTGIGDCKALSLFMQSMLEIVGIKSDYVIVHTDNPRLMEGFHTPGQMNHAMLCVPLQTDTLWLECTNPRYPLGYRHESIAGHDVVLAKSDGSKKMMVKPYPDSLHFRSESATVRLMADGSAECTVMRALKLTETESYIGFSGWNDKAQFNALMSGNSLRPVEFKVKSVKDNFTQYVDSSYIPEMQISYSFLTKEYAKVSGDRIFFDINPFSKSLYSERGDRKNEIQIGSGRIICDTVRVDIPEGYVIESLPSSSTIKSDFGALDTIISADEQYVFIIQKIVLYRGIFPKEAYPEYRTFARDVTKSYASRIVLRKK